MSYETYCKKFKANALNMRNYKNYKNYIKFNHLMSLTALK